MPADTETVTQPSAIVANPHRLASGLFSLTQLFTSTDIEDLCQRPSLEEAFNRLLALADAEGHAGPRPGYIDAFVLFRVNETQFALGRYNTRDEDDWGTHPFDATPLDIAEARARQLNSLLSHFMFYPQSIEETLRDESAPVVYFVESLQWWWADRLAEGFTTDAAQVFLGLLVPPTKSRDLSYDTSTEQMAYRRVSRTRPPRRTATTR